MLSRSVILAAAIALGATQAYGQKLYKHVGPDGTVVYTDRPVQAGQKEEKKKPANVAAPEASRQVYLASASFRKRRPRSGAGTRRSGNATGSASASGWRRKRPRIPGRCRRRRTGRACGPAAPARREARRRARSLRALA
jgi:hypothetical protein